MVTEWGRYGSFTSTALRWIGSCCSNEQKARYVQFTLNHAFECLKVHADLSDNNPQPRPFIVHTTLYSPTLTLYLR